MVAPRLETVTQVRVSWESISADGSVLSTSYKSTELQAAAELIGRVDDYNLEVERLTRDGIDHTMTPVCLVGIRRRVVTTVEIAETGALQPIPESANGVGINVVGVDGSLWRLTPGDGEGAELDA